MNKPPSATHVSVSISRLPGLWLLAACVLGGIGFWTQSSDWVIGSRCPLPFGRLIHACYGAFLYGWALPLLFKSCPSLQTSRMSLLLGLWHLFVLIGEMAILIGEGSGWLLLPFPRWIIPALCLVSGFRACLGGTPGYRFLMSPESCLIPACITVSMGVMWKTQAVSSAGVLNSFALEACLLFACAFGALLSTETAEKSSPNNLSNLLRRSGAVVLLAGTLVGNLGLLQACPVSWRLAECGMWWSCLAILPLLGWSIRLFFTSSPDSVKSLSVMIVLLFCGNAYANFCPEWSTFSLAMWFFPLAVILCSGAVMTLSAPLPKGGPVCFVGAGVGGILLTILGFMATNDAAEFPLFRRPEVLSDWVRLLSILSLPVLACALLGSLMTLSGRSASPRTPDNSPPTDRPCSFAYLAIWCVMLGWGALIAYLHRPEPSDREVVRPSADAEGARIYAAEGCSLCHTQVIRRLSNGKEWQESVDRLGDSEDSSRVSEPEDWDVRGSGEGAAQWGRASVGPDLSRVRATYSTHPADEQGQGKGTSSVLIPTQEMALHLYNPRNPSVNKRNSACPPMPHLFAWRQTEGSFRSHDALPLDSGNGTELIPNERGRHLLRYLASLRRPEPTPIPGRTQDKIPSAHIHPDYAAAPPTITRKNSDRSSARGRSIYMTKCALCHGAQGLGREDIYPPLADSDWLRDKTDEELIRVITQGLKGPIVVSGKEWNSVMIPPGVTEPKQIADLLHYLRRQFGKHPLPNITPEQVRSMTELMTK